MPTFDVGGSLLDYEVSGDDGPLVVQLHGLTSSRARDHQLGLDLGRALRGHRVLRYDARAHGGSTGSADEAHYRWDRLADDLLHLLDHVAPGEKVHGVGPSMGTGTLLHAAVREQERFESLTLVTPPTAWKARVAQAEFYRHGAELVEREGLVAFEELGSTAPVPPALSEAPQTRPSVPESLLPIVLRGAAASDFPPRDRIAEIQTPTLILAWSGDRTHPVKTATKLDEILPHSRVVVARTAYGIMAWPGLFAEHVITAAARV